MSLSAEFYRDSADSPIGLIRTWSEEYKVVERVLEVLNRALEADRTAISLLLNTRVPCNSVLTEDPTIQVMSHHDDLEIPENCGKVGLLGIINGLCGVDERGWGLICTVANKETPHIVEKFAKTSEHKKLQSKVLEPDTEVVE